jgi:hypothetical protein
MKRSIEKSRCDVSNNDSAKERGVHILSHLGEVVGSHLQYQRISS